MWIIACCLVVLYFIKMAFVGEPKIFAEPMNNTGTNQNIEKDLNRAAGCCIGYTGNTNCSELDEPDVSDIVRLIDYLYVSHEPLCCPGEADVNGSSDPEPDLSDIVRLIDYLYLSHEPLPDCL